MSRPDEAGCPCGRLGAAGRPLPLSRCCGRFLGVAGVPAPDAESLMRSRYCAYVLGNVAYLLATWHRSSRPQEVALAAGTKWLGLQVCDYRVRDETHAEVEFVARYRVRGQGVRLRERSRFLREEGRWYYLDGDIEGDGQGTEKK